MKSRCVYPALIIVLLLVLLWEAFQVERLRAHTTDEQKTAIQVRREAADLRQRGANCDAQFLSRVGRDLDALAEKLCEELDVPAEE